MANEKDILAEEREEFEDAADAEADNRTEALEDLLFARLGQQWPDNVKADREREGRPTLTINFMPAFIRQVVNDARMNRPQIKVSGVDNKSDPATADILSGAIRNIEYRSKADIAYDTAIDHAASLGFGYIRVNIDYENDNTFEKHLTIGAVTNPFSVYGDPNSTSSDSADWNRAFVTDLMDKEVFEGTYPDADKVNWDDDAWSDLGAPWRQDDSVLVCESWKREKVAKTLLKLSNGDVMDEASFANAKDLLDAMGVTVVASRPATDYKVTQRLMNGAQILKTTEWVGKYIPIVPVYGEEINVEGKRYLRSLINQAKDSQRMVNYWQTTATEITALAPKVPYIGEEGAFSVDPEKWATANSKSWPYLEVKKGKQIPQRQPMDVGQAIGATSEAMKHHDNMKAVLGLYDASLGNRSNETSGVAINSRKHEGDVSTFHFHDNQNRSIRHVGVVLVDLIPKVYSDRQVLRIIGADDNERLVNVGKRPQGQNATPPQFSQQEQMQAISPNKWNDVNHIYDLTIGDYDVAVDTGPSYTTRREETAAQMMDFLRAYPQAAPVVGDLLVKNLDWPNASEIADRLRAMLPAQVTGGLPPELQKQIQDGQNLIHQLQQENAALKMQNDSKAHTAKTSEIELQIKSYQAETERAKVLVPYMTPEMAAALGLQAANQIEGQANPEAAPSEAQVNLTANMAENFGQAIAPHIVNALHGAIQTMPPIKMEAPPVVRMKRTPVRDPNGLIMHTIDEPINDTVN